MKKRTELEWIACGFIAVALVGIFSAFVAHMVDMVRSLGKDKIGDAATWFGALFAGLAFAGTIYIANSQKREKRQASLLKAKLIANSYSLQILVAQHQINAAADAIFNVTQNGLSVSAIHACAVQLKEIRIWSMEDTVAMIPLGDSIAIRFGRVRQEILHSIDFLTKTSQELGQRDIGDELKALAELSDLLRRTSKSMDDLSEKCHAHGADLF